MNNRNTKRRTAMAATQAVADTIPDCIYNRMGALIAWYWEDAAHRADCFEQLEWLFRDFGSLASGGVIRPDQAEAMVGSFLGALIMRPRKLPTDARATAGHWLEDGGRTDASKVTDRLRSDGCGDPNHRPVSPLVLVHPSTPPPPQAERQDPPAHFAPTPFVLQDPTTLPRRDWLYGTHLIRKEISAVVAPGGVGKTALGVVEALAMASGKPLLGVHIARPLRVWLWNGEEPQEELNRRIHGACLHYGLTAEDLGGRLMVDNGHDMPLVLAAQSRDGTRIYEPVVDALVDAARERGVDAMILDPFVSTHNVTENDNNAIQMAATAWKTVAVRADIAISLAHHTKKLGGRDAVAEDARGADALVAKCRDVRALNMMSEAEARTLDVPPLARFSHFWTGGAGAKVNMSPRTGKKVWFRMVSVGLGNGHLTAPEDSIGVVEAWTPDYAAEALPSDAIAKLQLAMTGQQWRSAWLTRNRPDWIGNAVADAFEIGRGDGGWMEAAQKMVRRLDAEGILARSTARNEQRKEVPVYIFRQPDEEGEALEGAA